MPASLLGVKLPGFLAGKFGVPVAVAAAGGAGLLGLRARKARGAAAAPPSVVTSTGTLLPGGGSTYDSTASDVYSSIQPQLEALYAQIAAMGSAAPTQALLDPAASYPAPAPVAAAAAAPAPQPAQQPPPIVLAPGSTLGPATGVGTQYSSGGYTFTYG
ncbi:MAG: hypothetical protein ACR2MO_08595 [Acidimicrobiales bacterium]